MPPGLTHTLPFRFLDLPPEIRSKIYILLVQAPYPINLSPTHLNTPPTPYQMLDRSPFLATPLYPRYPLSLLLSCVQIHYEVLPVYFTLNIFTLTIRRHNDTYSTFLSPSSTFRPKLLSIRTLRLIILRFGSHNYFAGTVVPILEECILNGKLRNLEVWVRDTTCRAGKDENQRRGYERGVGNEGTIAEYDNWGLLRKLCRDPWLERVSLRAGWVEEMDGEVVGKLELCKSVPLV